MVQLNLTALFDALASVSNGLIDDAGIVGVINIGMSTVAVINTNDDVIDMLRTVLEHEGIDSVAGHVIEFKRGKADFEEFVERYNPEVIIYDVAPPYRENWEFFEALSRSAAGRNRRFVLTTANKRLPTQAAVKHIRAYEISEKPYDLDAIVHAVKRQLD